MLKSGMACTSASCMHHKILYDSLTTFCIDHRFSTWGVLDFFMGVRKCMLILSFSDGRQKIGKVLNFRNLTELIVIYRGSAKLLVIPQLHLARHMFESRIW